MFAIKIDGSAEGYAATPVWTNTAVGARFTTPVLKDGMLFGYNGHLFCADARTGATLWSDSTSRGMSAAVLDAGSEMIALGVNSELVVFEPSGKEYKELAKLKVANTETWAHPVLAGNRIFIRDHDSVSLLTTE
jgi:outer membrane protein assembly factor BamB